jgi:hypothetical protein
MALVRGEPPAVRWLWCHPLVIDGPVGDDPVPMPEQMSSVPWPGLARSRIS